MAQILVRGLEDDVKDRLREMAREQGQSVEETVRTILRNATRAKKSSREGLGTQISKRFKGWGLKEGEIQELRGHTIQLPDFGK